MALMALMCCLTANAEEAEINGLWYELVSRAKEAKVIMYRYDVKYFGDVVIPETVDYEGTEYSVTSIGEYAFYECSGLTSVTIPGSVTNIGKYAFYECTSLTSVTIGNSVTSIGEWAFDDCSGLTSVHITDLAAWCKISFSNSSSNPLHYAHHLYLNNQEITDLVIPEGVTSIGGYAFQGCTGLTSVTIPNSVTSIGNWAFYGCSGLTSVTIPNSVTSIGEWAFRGCSGLTSVTIGNSIKTISTNAFAYCPELADVYCYSEQVPATESNVFENSYPNYSTLHVPASAIDAYKIEPWIGFKEIVALTDKELAVDAVHGDESMEQAPIYDLSGRRLAAPRKGINIVGGKKVVVR